VQSQFSWDDLIADLTAIVLFAIPLFMWLFLESVLYGFLACIFPGVFYGLFCTGFVGYALDEVTHPFRLRGLICLAPLAGWVGWGWLEFARYVFACR
jgi:hypothetical protein